ncbi:hypothetical protein TYRP_012990 [Tyrophagus putrescentiae]|nr:hypothetical protein TYRP_012990 [Tyrophagus putrescentiae]
MGTGEPPSRWLLLPPLVRCLAEEGVVEEASLVEAIVTGSSSSSERTVFSVEVIVREQVSSDCGPTRARVPSCHLS